MLEIGILRKILTNTTSEMYIVRFSEKRKDGEDDQMIKKKLSTSDRVKRGIKTYFYKPNKE